jgi:hypothetical protein
MVAPLIVAGAIALGTGIAQYMNSEAARNASAAELSRMRQLYEKLQSPTFDPADFTPEDYMVVQKYVPEQARFVEQVAPETVKAASEGAVRGRSAQFAALDRLRQVGSGEDPFQGAVIQQAQQEASKAAGSQREALMQQYARRGMGGSGLELSSQLQSQSDAFGRGADVGLAGGMERYKSGLQAMRDAANLGGQIRGEDVSLETANAGIINDFNTRNTDRMQGFANQVADTRNQAQQYNIGQAQGVANQNVAGRNQAKRDKVSNTQQQFNNQVAIADRQAGIGGQAITQVNQNAADRNQMIQGVGNAGTGIAMYNTKPQPSIYNESTGEKIRKYDPYTGQPV